MFLPVAITTHKMSSSLDSKSLPPHESPSTATPSIIESQNHQSSFHAISALHSSLHYQVIASFNIIRFFRFQLTYSRYP